MANLHPGDMAEVVSLVDAITADGYALEADYFGIFRDTPDTESILHLRADSTVTRIWNGLHYNSTTIEGGGWNGFSTLAEYYDLFEGDANGNEISVERWNTIRQSGMNEEVECHLMEHRLQVLPGTTNEGGFENGSNVGFGFLVGQQYGLRVVMLLHDRAGAPLTFKREFDDGTGATSFINNDETTGIRVIKYHPRYGGRLQAYRVIFRYSDALLMKAEAILAELVEMLRQL